MKKFSFTLQPLVKYKETIERMQKEELRRAQQILRDLQTEENRLLLAYSANEHSLEEALRKNENVGQALSEHDAYFRYLREAIKVIRDKISKAELVVQSCQDRLIATMKELKTYDKLKQEQFAEYLKEVQMEEDKDMGDLISFKTIASERVSR